MKTSILALVVAVLTFCALPQYVRADYALPQPVEPCDDESPDDALATGIEAADKNSVASAFACFVSSAHRSNASAQVDVAAAYELRNRNVKRFAT